MESKIKSIVGENGQIESLVFDNDKKVKVKGGFILPKLSQASYFAKEMGCEYNSLGGILTDAYGRTNIQGVYAAGDASIIAPAQLIISAAKGLQAAVGVNRDFTEKEFLE